MTVPHPPEGRRGRSSYETPKLRRFGDVAELTLAVGNMGNKDGAKGKAHGTSL